MPERAPKNKNLIITIDGPSGAGKSTVARMVARSLAYRYIDTGAMYRGVACAFMRQKKKSGSCGSRVDETGDLLCPEEMAALFEDLMLRFEFGEETRVFLNGQDISEEIREPAVSLLASRLSQSELVRNYLGRMQRAEGKNGAVVLEGRDTGSVVFPDAHVKFYLDASPEIRAARRHLELSAKGHVPDLSTVKEEMVRRDKNDSERNLAPLVVPEGAIYVDTTGLDIQGVVDVLLKHIRSLEGNWK
ncbi:MAG: Cytidylate kinase [Syntrophorhabdus sp. PtaU1.Bin153]|nr:MAG: Cytidylate kinase [Syntrophorhabdus sp. PtaU1.Bin153]